MRALTFHGGRTIRPDTVPDPTIAEPTDAIVQVELAGICGSDMHIYHERERGQDPGTVMGHEFVGQVVEVGADVCRVSAGHRVASPFTTSCGACFYCLEGLTARCERGQLFGWVERGRGLHGAQAEYVRVPLADSTLVPLSDDVRSDDALLLGDVLSTGFYCARQGGIRASDVVAVIGCGPVGLMGLIGAKEHGATTIVAVDSVAERLDRARALGAHTVDFAQDDPLEVVRSLSEGRGADVVLELVGSPEALRSAYRLVRPGGVISVVGVHNEDHLAFSPAEAYDKNLTFRVGRCPARHMMEALLPLVREGRYDLASVISHRLPLERGADGYAMFDEKRDGCTKVVLLPQLGT